MTLTLTKRGLFALPLYAMLGRHAIAQTADPLPSWHDGPAKKAIADFVARVTTPGNVDHVQPAERIATFDNDGTLWMEQPIYFQLAFVHHDDGSREYAYDRQSHIGKLDLALDEGARRNWTIVSMKQDWRSIFR
jgi:hypothetical protein